MSYELNQIPVELKNAHQWIVWRSETREGKPTKVPYQVNGEMAQSNNRRTWSTFHTAARAYMNGKYDGIGFMFSKDDTFIGIDIDHCVVDGAPSQLAQEIIELMDSYTEFSPSGDGIHIIVKGKLPSTVLGTGKKDPKIGLEVYQHGRYFTFTGNRENDNEVFERTDELEELFDKYFKEKEVVHSRNTSNKSSLSNLSNSELWSKMFRGRNGDNIRSLFDGELVNNDHSASDLALCNHLAFWTDKDESKIDSMFRESALMRDKWDKVHHSNGETYGERTIRYSIESTQNTVSDFEQKPYQIHIDQIEEEPEGPQPAFMRTDLGNAERLVYKYGKNIRYNNSFKKWYLWNGKQWIEDDTNQIGIIAKHTVRSIYNEASNEADDSVRAALSKHAVQSESRSRVEAMISLAKSEVPIVPEDLDKDKWLFNCNNGVVDLKTGDFLPHDRDYYMNKISPIDYDEHADCPMWKKFLEDIMQDEKGNVKHELIEFLQRSIGYSLTGDTSEQVLFILYGKGRNGKSTFLDTIRYLLGDYGTQANTESFTVRKNDSVRSDLAALKGSRFVSAAESEEGAKLAESLVKQLTGGDPIQARFLYGNPFVFTPEFKLFFMTNYKPNIGGSDLGIWRRIRLIPFTVTVPEEKTDKHLGDKLIQQEMPGILRWAMEGCLKWQKDGLGYPKDVQEATDGYRNEMDVIGKFLNENCVASENAKCYSKELYRRYEEWCDETGEYLFPKVKFNRKIEERGHKKKKDNKGYFFQGLGINTSHSYSFTTTSSFKKKI